MDENNSTPKPWEEPVAPPVEQPTPAETIEPQPESVESQPELTPAPEEKPAEKPKKDNKLVLILVGVLVLIAVIVGVIVIISDNNAKNAKTTTTATVTTTTSTKDDKDDDETNESDVTAMSINTEISNDLSFVITALYNYQANNRGAIPTIEIANKEDETNPKSWQYFINNYLDTNSGGQETQFTDTYQIKVCNLYEGTCPKMADLNWSQNKYTIYIAVKATCSTAGEVEMNEGTRHVAVFSVKKPYSTMTNKYYCLNN